MKNSEYIKPDTFSYLFVRAVGKMMSLFLLKRKILRNEIRGKKGPYIIIANHQSKIDAAMIFDLTAQPANFVISKSFFLTLPKIPFVTRIGLIPKQQFRTTLRDLFEMKKVIENNGILVLFPAGLMSENGLSTPVPEGTYRFLKWLDADIYAAKVSGTYFVNPKWSTKLRPGRTYADIFRLFDRAELKHADISEIKQKTDEALMFDAYREQEKLMVKYRNADNITGLENVLYVCPGCGTEFTMKTEKNRIYCTHCGYTETCDEFGFLCHTDGNGPEIRRGSDWSRYCEDSVAAYVEKHPDIKLSLKTEIQTIDIKRKKYVFTGRGTVSLSAAGIRLYGTDSGKNIDITASLTVPELPFGPGQYVEIQTEEKTFRCMLDDGKQAMKFMHVMKKLYSIMQENRISTLHGNTKG